MPLTYLTKLCIETNRVDSDQTAPMAASSGSTLFAGKASKTFWQTTKGYDFYCDWHFKDIEILVIILVPLIMTLSRGHTGQIKGQS